MTERVTCVVAEDEQLFREALLALLREEWPALQVLAACEDGGAALEAIGEHKPDLAFLDIRMPGLTGLEVAAATSEVSPATQIVFVTAYDQYAIQAFERGAVDYLLKPIARERLNLAYGADATFDIAANFPAGVAATISVPAAGPREVRHD